MIENARASKPRGRMSPDDLDRYIMKSYQDVHRIDAWGECSYFINPEKRLKRGTYFCTLKKKDGENDKASKLDRPDIFRLNAGLTKPLYIDLFGAPPKRPAKGGVIKGDYDFSALDTIMPHPVYGWMSWIFVLNPSLETFDRFKFMLDIAYNKASEATQKKLKAF